jgi:hypothetical protein
MDDKRDKTVPPPEETHRGEHNELHYYNADEGKSYDERGSQTQGAGETEREHEADE